MARKQPVSGRILVRRFEMGHDQLTPTSGARLGQSLGPPAIDTRFKGFSQHRLIRRRSTWTNILRSQPKGLAKQQDHRFKPTTWHARSNASTMASTVNSVRTEASASSAHCCGAAEDGRGGLGGRAQRFNIADGHQSTCFSGTHTSLCHPSVATTGTPASIACTTTRGSPSRYRGAPADRRIGSMMDFRGHHSGHNNSIMMPSFRPKPNGILSSSHPPPEQPEAFIFCIKGPSHARDRHDLSDRHPGHCSDDDVIRIKVVRRSGGLTVDRGSKASTSIPLRTKWY